MPKGRGGEEKEMKGPNLSKYNFFKKFTKSPKVMTFDEKAAALKAGKTPYKGQSITTSQADRITAAHRGQNGVADFGELASRESKVASKSSNRDAKLTEIKAGQEVAEEIGGVENFPIEKIGGVTGFTGGETKAAESTNFKELLRTDSALQQDAHDLQERIAEREAAIQRANALKVGNPSIITDIKIPPLSQAPERPLQRGNRPGR